MGEDGRFHHLVFVVHYMDDGEPMMNFAVGDGGINDGRW